MDFIYSSPKSNGENGFFSITNDTRGFRSGDEQKDLALSIAKPELVFDLQTMEVVDSSINTATKILGGSSIPLRKSRRGNGEEFKAGQDFGDMSFDSPVSVLSLGQGSEDGPQGVSYSSPERPYTTRSTPTTTTARAKAVRFAHPALPSSLASARARSTRIMELPRPDEIPIVEVFKSANVIQTSNLSPKMRFRLSKLKFELKSEENW